MIAKDNFKDLLAKIGFLNKGDTLPGTILAQHDLLLSNEK